MLVSKKRHTVGEEKEIQRGMTSTTHKETSRQKDGRTEKAQRLREGGKEGYLIWEVIVDDDVNSLNINTTTK